MGSEFFPLRVTPKFKVVQLTPLKNKNDFLTCQMVWKTAKCQGKIREKSGNFEVDDKWQPWGKAYTDKGSIR